MSFSNILDGNVILGILKNNTFIYLLKLIENLFLSSQKYCLKNVFGSHNFFLRMHVKLLKYHFYIKNLLYAPTQQDMRLYIIV